MSTRLYVGNLSFDTTEHTLSEAFSRFGTVTEVSLIMDKFTGRSRGFGFVTMDSAQSAQAAIQQMDGQSLDGRNLTVNEARPREDRGGSGSGQRGDRGDRSWSRR